jgi:spore coat-associated protein N
MQSGTDVQEAHMDGKDAKSRLRRRGAVVFTGLVAAGTVAMGSGTYALFSSTRTADLPIGAGTVLLDEINGANNSLSLAASDLAPGDSIQRVVNVKNVGTIPMGRVTLATTALSPGSLLDSDGTNGLQMQIEQCAAPWQPTTQGGIVTYACSGGATSVLGARRVVMPETQLPGLDLARDANNYLRVTVALPASAGNEFQDQSSTIRFSFVGYQDAADPEQ